MIQNSRNLNLKYGLNFNMEPIMKKDKNGWIVYNKFASNNNKTTKYEGSQTGIGRIWRSYIKRTYM